MTFNHLNFSPKQRLHFVGCIGKGHYLYTGRLRLAGAQRDLRPWQMIFKNSVTPISTIAEFSPSTESSKGWFLLRSATEGGSRLNESNRNFPTPSNVRRGAHQDDQLDSSPLRHRLCRARLFKIEVKAKKAVENDQLYQVREEAYALRRCGGYQQASQEVSDHCYRLMRWGGRKTTG